MDAENVRHWTLQLQLNIKVLTDVPGEEGYQGVLTCDGHAQHQGTLRDLLMMLRAWEVQWKEADQDSGERLVLVQELISLYGLVANSVKLPLDVPEETPALLRGVE